MLPKPEKIKKTKVEQQDIFEKIDQEKNIRAKRTYLLVSIFLTIGLSLIFYSFSRVKTWITNLSFSPPQKISKISTSNPINSVLTFLKGDDNDWLIIVKTPQASFSNKDNYLNNKDYFDSLSQIKISSSSLISSILPQGINYRESIKNLESKYIYTTEIILPKNNFFLHIEISGFSNLENSISKIPEIAKNIYWATVPLI